ncbi:hypothetical protein Tco_0652903 [Tanacetum coccineum]|uniref:Uncharacterized protein n=1 Tax=Tanacetum coccineum TaxID=301880 RepID=A0ABQ4WZ00_9ASTR
MRLMYEKYVEDWTLRKQSTVRLTVGLSPTIILWRERWLSRKKQGIVPPRNTENSGQLESLKKCTSYSFGKKELEIALYVVPLPPRLGQVGVRVPHPACCAVLLPYIRDSPPISLHGLRASEGQPDYFSQAGGAHAGSGSFIVSVTSGKGNLCGVGARATSPVSVGSASRVALCLPKDSELLGKLEEAGDAAYQVGSQSKVVVTVSRVGHYNYMRRTAELPYQEVKVLDSLFVKVHLVWLCCASVWNGIVTYFQRLDERGKCPSPLWSQLSVSSAEACVVSTIQEVSWLNEDSLNFSVIVFPSICNFAFPQLWLLVCAFFRPVCPSRTSLSSLVALLTSAIFSQWSEIISPGGKGTADVDTPFVDMACRGPVECILHEPAVESRGRHSSAE